MENRKKRCAVIALGGNAISPPGSGNTIADQFMHTRRSLHGLKDLLHKNYLLAITHGNGPQVGDALRRVELTKDVLPSKPLGILVADTQGSMGYMIEQSLQNLLQSEQIDRQVISVITQVLVDRDDSALNNPTKFVGQVFSREQAEILTRDEGWSMRQYNEENKWRRVVGSPNPLKIINNGAIRNLVQSGVITIAAGGGGIPVYRDSRLGLEGCDAVIDKDLASSILAKEIDADELIILTNVDNVKVNFGRSDEMDLKRINVAEASRYLDEGQFPPGSMGPKIMAAINFLQDRKGRVIICSLKQVNDALNGKAGTEIIP